MGALRALCARSRARACIWSTKCCAVGGQEQRLHPSTKRSATIGGFVAGGSGGVGSVTWGGLREPGNVLAARVVTLEETPRAIELRGDAAQKINRAYGTTGIITALEMPLAPAVRLDRRRRRLRRFRRRLRGRARRRAGRRRRQEAGDADLLADPPLFRAVRERLSRKARAC